ncbi:MAG: Zn-dependent oligopeptidase [Sphingomonas adhaesiva]|uniref:M3 family metallopeptidase n=1 Tax=Sphingomonas adhaesiva TaxID=28212 RepID=UPI002FF9186D
MTRHLLLLPSLLALVAAQAPTAAPASDTDAMLNTTALTPADPAAVAALCDRYLARAMALRTALEKESGPATLASFRRFDDIAGLLGAAAGDSSLIAEVAPDEPRREAGRACQTRVNEAATALQLSRPVYDRLKAVPLAGADAETQHVVRRTLADFDRAGVSRDEATRARVAALSKRISELEVRFEGNIAGSRLVVKADPAELDGLPADFVAAHKPGADGKVEISTDYPDLMPVMSYARSDALRRRLYTAFQSRAWPQNDAVLSEMFTTRDTLAKLLGRPNYATVALENKMVDTPAKAAAFIDRGVAAGDPYARRDLARLVERLRKDQPGATDIAAWQTGYYGQLVRKEQYAVDPQAVRQYFAYDDVRDGMLQLTRDLMGVEIRPWKTATWDPAVEAYEMLDGGQVIGRFYFDTHPRPGKYSHANVVPLRAGVAGRVIPMAALVTNFPAGDHTTGLMEHRDVETFLHEYGHLIHVMLSGRVHYASSGMGNLEWDFIEAPSQMLENFVWDYDTLARFAKDAKGNVIPRDLVERMNRARYFGEALGDRRQFGLSNASLGYHLGPPQPDLTAQYIALNDRYALPPTPAGVHPQAAWGHLGGYSAYYYTYMWSKTIALDLWTRFEREGLRNPAVARAYREKVLAPGGAKPAAALVQDFLGRPLSLDAYTARLAKGK